MVKHLREQFNDQFTEQKYQNFLRDLEKDFIEIPFRVAETPIFIPEDLLEKLTAAGEEIIALIKQDNFKSLTQASIPADWQVPNENDHPHFLTFDFGICRDDDGTLIPKLIEMQGFPSLYGFQLHMGKSYVQAYDLPQKLTPLLSGLDEVAYMDLLKKVILGNHQPHEVALMDVDAQHQKTAIDFYVTQQYVGMKVLALGDIVKDGHSLYYFENGEKIKLKRIYNRLIFDEVADKVDVFKSSFDPREE
jgi:hypothetical protein